MRRGRGPGPAVLTTRPNPAWASRRGGAGGTTWRSEFAQVDDLVARDRAQGLWGQTPTAEACGLAAHLVRVSSPRSTQPDKHPPRVAEQVDLRPRHIRPADGDLGRPIAQPLRQRQDVQVEEVAVLLAR